MIPLQKQYYIQFRQLIADKSIPALKKETDFTPSHALYNILSNLNYIK